MNPLRHQHIVLGITGGIAAYKSADLVRRLREAGAEVQVVMTNHAKQFITPLTLQAVSGHRVHDDLWDLEAEAAMGHIALARWADVVLIAPATANCLAKLANGMADDLLTTLCLATRAPVLLAPAMNQAMWHHPQTVKNAKALRDSGMRLLGPGEGSQACGEVGFGRMLEPEQLVTALAAALTRGVLAGKTVCISAGPTREYLDSVRFISNASSGKMGFALAEAAKEAGAHVILVSGPVALSCDKQINRINVVSAEEMHEAVMSQVAAADVFISVAAVSDYRPAERSGKKLPKHRQDLQLKLVLNQDIVSSVSQLPRRPFIVGFAAETDHLKEKARAKMRAKQLDMIVANQVNEEGMGFESDDNACTVLWDDQEQSFARTHKATLARQLIPLIADQLKRYVK